MPRWLFALLFAILFTCGSGMSRAQKPHPPPPDQFVIGRRTFFDFGPPFEFYEVFSIHSEGEGASIDRVTLTPEGDACTQPATFEVATVSIKQSVADLLGKQNPCAIPEKELRRELKRCKGCPVFSGADVAMQIQCGDQSRRIRMDILDRDMFDGHPKTPQHTSWTMALLGRLDQTVGNTVMDRPAFGLSEPPAALNVEFKSKVLKGDLSQGKFDVLFDKATHKPSELFRAAQIPALGPSVELIDSSPFRPTSYTAPKYPPLARLTHIGGEVTLTFDITSRGGISNLKFLSGQAMLQRAVETAAATWKFPAEAAGQEIWATIEFKTNCPPVHN